MLALKKDALRALVLALGALAVVLACNSAVDNPNHSATLIEVVSATPVSSDPTSAVDDSTTMVLKARPRNPGATTFFNDVTFTDYRVEYSAELANISGVISTGYIPAGGSANLTLVVVRGPDKGLAVAGTTINARITVNGKDLSDHNVSFTATVPVTFTTSPDTDGDGVPDATDNCPLVFNPSQLDTFPVGGNGVGDCCDPTTPGYPVCSP